MLCRRCPARRKSCGQRKKTSGEIYFCSPLVVQITYIYMYYAAARALGCDRRVAVTAGASRRRELVARRRLPARGACSLLSTRAASLGDGTRHLLHAAWPSSPDDESRDDDPQDPPAVGYDAAADLWDAAAAAAAGQHRRRPAGRPKPGSTLPSGPTAARASPDQIDGNELFVRQKNRGLEDHAAIGFLRIHHHTKRLLPRRGAGEIGEINATGLGDQRAAVNAVPAGR